MNTKTNEAKKLVSAISLPKWMYKILTGESTFAEKVKINGVAVRKM